QGRHLRRQQRGSGGDGRYVGRRCGRRLEEGPRAVLQDAAAGRGTVRRGQPDSRQGGARHDGADQRRDPGSALSAGAAAPGKAANAAARRRPAVSRPTRIAVLGADGRMGRALTRAVAAAGADAKLTAACERAGHPAIGNDAGVLAGGEPLGVAVTGALPPKGAADVWIDFTTAQFTQTVCKAAMAAEAALVVGTTGLGPEARA